jgi:hypothetical protein
MRYRDYSRSDTVDERLAFAIIFDSSVMISVRNSLHLGSAQPNTFLGHLSNPDNDYCAYES